MSYELTPEEEVVVKSLHQEPTPHELLDRIAPQIQEAQSKVSAAEAAHAQAVTELTTLESVQSKLHELVNPTPDAEETVSEEAAETPEEEKVEGEQA